MKNKIKKGRFCMKKFKKMLAAVTASALVFSSAAVFAAAEQTGGEK